MTESNLPAPVDGDDYTWDSEPDSLPTGYLSAWISHGIRLETGGIEYDLPADGIKLEAAYNTGTCAERHDAEMAALRADVKSLAERLADIEGVLRRWQADS